MSHEAPAAPPHVGDLLAAYISNTLDPVQTRQVRRHLAVCGACQAEEETWRRIAAALQTSEAAVTAPSPTTMLPRIWARIDAEPAPPIRLPPAARLALGGRIVLAQARLIHRSVWLASACAFAAVLIYALFAARRQELDTVLGLALPLITAAGAAFLYGPEADPALEITQATPVPARGVLLARCGLLVAYDLGLALLLTALLAGPAGQGLDRLTALWLGPMALLSAISLLGSLLAGPLVAFGGAVALWLTRLLPLVSGASLPRAPDGWWQTNPPILLVAAALFLLALLYADRRPLPA